VGAVACGSDGLVAIPPVGAVAWPRYAAAVVGAVAWPRYVVDYYDNVITIE